MMELLKRIGGVMGLTVRARLTAAYSLTSVIAAILLGTMLFSVIQISEHEWQVGWRTLLFMLGVDLIGQTYYNERLLKSITVFLRTREEGGEIDANMAQQATADFLALPRKIALACLAFWFLTVSGLVAMQLLFTSMSWLKLGYIVATTIIAAGVAFVFQYSLFRRVMHPVGIVLVRYGAGIQSIRDGFHLSARMRLWFTFLLLVFSALALSGLMAYGQFVRLSAEQAGVIDSASLGNLAEDLPEDHESWETFVFERQRFVNFDLALWDTKSEKLLGSLPIKFADIKGHFTQQSGNFEDAKSLSRVSYRTTGEAILVGVSTPKNYLRGSYSILGGSLLLLVITLLFTGFIFNLVTRDIVAPFTQMRKFMRSIAKGELGDAPLIVTEDELGRLGMALQDMALGLRSMFADLQSSLRNVKSLRQDIAVNLREIQTRSADQDRNVDRSFMSFSELNQALRDITDNVTVVDKAARESRDAAQEMGRFLEDIRGELAELLDTLRGSSRFILSMLENAENSSRGVGELHTNIEGLRGGIFAIQTAFSKLSDEMQKVLDSSGQASVLANNAIVAADETSVGVGRVKSSTEDLLGELQRFREGIKRIAGVVSVISEVTEQTALLAFNAAILAAQSQDEHAKDFAVVGDEIKDLAERTESSTKDVGLRMNAIHDRTNHSLDEMRDALGLIQQGQLLTLLANDSMRLILEHSGRNDRDSRTIGEGIYYQAHNLSEILKSVDEELIRVGSLSGFTGENSHDAAALRSALDQMLEHIKHLQSTTSDQGGGGRQIIHTTDRISDGIQDMRKHLRRLAGGSGEVVQHMNDIRMISRRNAEQTDDMSSHLKKLDQLLKGVEAQLASVNLA